MCIKADEDARDVVRDIVTMPLNAVIAECLNVDVEAVHPGSRLVADLGMSAPTQKRLQRELAFIFDCAEMDIPATMKVEELLDHVANIEFDRLEANLPIVRASWYINPFRVRVRPRER